jgi:hypothetical protein
MQRYTSCAYVFTISTDTNPPTGLRKGEQTRDSKKKNKKIKNPHQKK